MSEHPLTELAKGDLPKRSWGASPTAMPIMEATEWRRLKAAATRCETCNVADDLDRWGRWQVPSHAAFCHKGKAYWRDQQRTAQTTDLKPPQRASYQP